MKRRTLLAIIVGTSTATVFGQTSGSDWPQWRGPSRDGTLLNYTEPKALPETLTQRWKVEVGTGYATPLIVGSRVFTFSRQQENEVMRALDAGTGKVLWETSYPAPFTMNPATGRHGPGPKATPTYANGRLFTFGISGIVTAFDAATGKILWQKPKGSTEPLYHTSQSPLVDRDAVILHVGGDKEGALTAWDAATGAVKWSWTGDAPAYASPILAEIGGTRQVITFSRDNLVGVDASNGQLLWKTPFQARSITNAITPLVYAGDTVIVSGQGKPLTAYAVSKQGDQWSVDVAWENPQLSLSFSNPVLVGDAVFSLAATNSGQFFWADAKTGKTLWTSSPRQGGNAAIVRAGTLLFVLKDDGQLMVARSSPGAFEPLRTYTVADSPTRTAPALSGNRIVVKDVSTVALYTFD
ncbi:MAG: PQQ-binding-like beta-propeller repeat protein [Vicinamibacterales bacterium]